MPLFFWGGGIEGSKGVSNDGSLNHDKNVAVEKEVSSPSDDIHGDDAVKDTNEVLKDPKHTSPKPYTLLLLFSHRMAKAKLNLQLSF